MNKEHIFNNTPLNITFAFTWDINFTSMREEHLFTWDINFTSKKEEYFTADNIIIIILKTKLGQDTIFYPTFTAGVDYINEKIIM